MTKIKKAVISACIALILITACIGTASATVNIWGADTDPANLNIQTNDKDYNQLVAGGDGKWYSYDSAGYSILWTDGGSNLVLPIYMNVTDSDNVFGYNLTLVGYTGIGNLKAAKGAYPAAYNITGAKISASVGGDTNKSEINSTNTRVNIVNTSFDVSATGNYYINITDVKLATSTKDLNSVSSLSELTGTATIANSGKVIAFKVMKKPYVDYFTLADDDKRKNSTTSDNTLYFYQERDSVTDGTTNKLNAIIGNKDNDNDYFIWKLDSGTGNEGLTLGIDTPIGEAQKNNFTNVSLTGTNSPGAYNNSVANITLLRTGESYLVNVNATYWNQSVSVANDKIVNGQKITFTYKVAAVPKDYVIGTGNNWDTFVELYPVGPYQNYTIHRTSNGDYTITNSTGKVVASTFDEDTGVKNLTITSSNYAGNAGPIAIDLYSGINGDPNEDNIVDIVDAAGVGIETIKVASSNSILKTAQQQFLADVDKSGVVTVADVLAIHDYIITQMS